MRIGDKKHERILEETIQQLQKEGYRTINLKGLSPTMIAVKNNITIAISLLKKKQTLTYLEDKYYMFDRIDRIYYNTDKKNNIDNILKQYRKNGYNIVYLQNKSPDAIAVKNDLIFAIEILGVKEGYDYRFNVKQKEGIYNMFDGLMIKTFNYESDNIYTETFGSNKQNNTSTHYEGVGG